MCDHSLPDVKIRLHHPSPSGKIVGYADPCIAPLVQALNDGGFQTIASCCGHDIEPRWIGFEDGVSDMGAMMFFRNHAELVEAGAFLYGKCLGCVSKGRWEAFHREFDNRYRKAMEGFQNEENQRV